MKREGWGQSRIVRVARCQGFDTTWRMESLRKRTIISGRIIMNVPQRKWNWKHNIALAFTVNSWSTQTINLLISLVKLMYWHPQYAKLRFSTRSLPRSTELQHLLKCGMLEIMRPKNWILFRHTRIAWTTQIRKRNLVTVEWTGTTLRRPIRIQTSTDLIQRRFQHTFGSVLLRLPTVWRQIAA